MIATANEHGVYIDGVEKIRLEGRMVVATILLAHGADEMWRWGYDNYIKGLHTGAGGASGGPHVAGDLYPTRDAAIQGCIDYLRAWAAHSAQGWPANVPGAAELGQMLDSIDPRTPRQLGLFGEEGNQ